MASRQQERGDVSRSKGVPHDPVMGTPQRKLHSSPGRQASVSGSRVTCTTL